MAGLLSRWVANFLLCLNSGAGFFRGLFKYLLAHFLVALRLILIWFFYQQLPYPFSITCQRPCSSKKI